MTLALTPPGASAPRPYLFYFAETPIPDLGIRTIALGLPVDQGGQLEALAWTLLTGSLALLAADLPNTAWWAALLSTIPCLAADSAATGPMHQTSGSVC